MIAPLDPIAFVAFQKRCELMGKDLPRPEADAIELAQAYWVWKRHGKPSVRHWADYGGRSVYWFTYPQDIGALRVTEDFQVDGSTIIALSEILIEKDATHNRNARTDFRADLEEATYQAKVQ